MFKITQSTNVTFQLSIYIYIHTHLFNFILPVNHFPSKFIIKGGKYKLLFTIHNNLVIKHTHTQYLIERILSKKLIQVDNLL